MRCRSLENRHEWAWPYRCRSQSPTVHVSMRVRGRPCACSFGRHAENMCGMAALAACQLCAHMVCSSTRIAPRSTLEPLPSPLLRASGGLWGLAPMLHASYRHSVHVTPDATLWPHMRACTRSYAHTHTQACLLPFVCVPPQFDDASGFGPSLTACPRLETISGYKLWGLGEVGHERRARRAAQTANGCEQCPSTPPSRPWLASPYKPN